MCSDTYFDMKKSCSFFILFTSYDKVWHMFPITVKKNICSSRRLGIKAESIVEIITFS